MHFEQGSKVHKTLEAITQRLDELGVPYAIAGAMCLFFHGYRRFTEDIDILVTREGLKKIHEELEGLGYVPPFAGSKNLRDAQSGVKIDFMVAGDYPGDGKPKPVAFPDPAKASIRIDGRNFLTLAKVLELKLASGMTNPLRLKDLADVEEAIKVLRPPASLADEIDPSVRGKFLELWKLVSDTPEDQY